VRVGKSAVLHAVHMKGRLLSRELKEGGDETLKSRQDDGSSKRRELEGNFVLFRFAGSADCIQGTAALLCMQVMLAPHRKHTCDPPRPVTGIALFYRLYL
jgi:hypothetical protein